MSGDASLYIWGSYLMGLVLSGAELALLALRYRNIRLHMGPSHRRGSRQSAREA